MRKVIPLILASIVTLSIGAPRAAAQLQPGTMIRVTTDPGPRATADRPGRGGNIIVGKLVEDTPDWLIVVQPTATYGTRIARRDVRKLEVAGANTKLRNAVIGAGVGAVAGLALIAIMYPDDGCRCEYDSCHCFSGRSAMALLGAGIGTCVGVTSGGTRWREVTPSPVVVSVRPTRRGVRLEARVTF